MSLSVMPLSITTPSITIKSTTLNILTVDAQNCYAVSRDPTAGLWAFFLCLKMFYNIGPVHKNSSRKIVDCTKAFVFTNQGILTEGEGSVQLTSSLS